MKAEDNKSNQKNKNKGSAGVNKQYAKAMGNKGKQLNPNQKKKDTEITLEDQLAVDAIADDFPWNQSDYF